MNSLIYYLHKLTKTNPLKILTRIPRKIKSLYTNNSKRRSDLNTATRSQIKNNLQSNFININTLDISKLNQKVCKYLATQYLALRFDLLGSGWIQNSYSSKVLGLEGFCYDMNVPIKEFDTQGKWLENILLPPHIKESQAIWQLINNPNYQPIDWQKDYKSGFRWSQKTWYKDQRIGLKKGADIKIPWELARFLHLPQMAIFASLLPDLKEKLICEFRNHVLDFIATNPPRMGVNWNCTMDVGIRIANILVAHDLFSQIDQNKLLDQKFQQILANSVHDHGLHIINNLENIGLTSNHYLANLAGLLFVSAYLDEKKWQEFAVNELLLEMEKQFNKDGTNFEASTNYHRLSSEIMTYSSALILGLGYKLPNWYKDRLQKAGLYSVHLTKPTGEIAQIGDNDSGRFFRFSPTGIFLTNHEAESKYLNLKGYCKLLKTQLNKKEVEKDLFWDENSLNHAGYTSAVAGLVPLSEFKPFSKEFPLEKTFVIALRQGSKK